MASVRKLFFPITHFFLIFNWTRNDEKASVLFAIPTLAFRDVKRVTKIEYHEYSHRHTNFREVEENFILKEVAVLVINATITGHWIMTSPCPFVDLFVKVRWENNWLIRNYHGIEWFDGDVQKFYDTSDITWHAISTPEDKRRHVIWIIYSLETYII